MARLVRLKHKDHDMIFSNFTGAAVNAPVTADALQLAYNPNGDKTPRGLTGATGAGTNAEESARRDLRDRLESEFHLLVQKTCKLGEICDLIEKLDWFSEKVEGSGTREGKGTSTYFISTVLSFFLELIENLNVDVSSTALP